MCLALRSHVSSLFTSPASSEITLPISLWFPDIQPSKLRGGSFYSFTSKTIILSFLSSNQHLSPGSSTIPLSTPPLCCEEQSFDSGQNTSSNGSLRKQEELLLIQQRCQIVYGISFNSPSLFILTALVNLTVFTEPYYCEIAAEVCISNKALQLSLSLSLSLSLWVENTQQCMEAVRYKIKKIMAHVQDWEKYFKYRSSGSQLRWRAVPTI